MKTPNELIGKHYTDYFGRGHSVFELDPPAWLAGGAALPADASRAASAAGALVAAAAGAVVGAAAAGLGASVGFAGAAIGVGAPAHPTIPAINRTVSHFMRWSLLMFS